MRLRIPRDGGHQRGLLRDPNAAYADRLHAVLCATGYNIKCLLRMILRRGISFF
jgi:hypothetical protein